MASGNRAQKVTDSDHISERCKEFLEHTYPGPHRTKLVQTALSVSEATAHRLFSGRSWTRPRIEQAMRHWPNTFQAYVFPIRGDTHGRLDRMFDEFQTYVLPIRGDMQARLDRMFDELCALHHKLDEIQAQLVRNENKQNRAVDLSKDEPLTYGSGGGLQACG